MHKKTIEAAGPLADSRQRLAAIGFVQVLQKNVVPLQDAENAAGVLPPDRADGPPKRIAEKNRVRPKRVDQESRQLVHFPGLRPLLSGEHRQREFAEHFGVVADAETRHQIQYGRAIEPAREGSRHFTPQGRACIEIDVDAAEKDLPRALVDFIEAERSVGGDERDRAPCFLSERAHVLSCMHDPQNIPAPPAVTIAMCMA